MELDGFGRYQAPVLANEFVSGFIVLDFPIPHLCEEDMEVLVERVRDLLAKEAKWIEGQMKGELPPRKARKNCTGS